MDSTLEMKEKGSINVRDNNVTVNSMLIQVINKIYDI